MLRIPEVADRLAVTTTTVRRLIGRGDLVAHRVGRVWRIEPQAVEEYLVRRANVDLVARTTAASGVPEKLEDPAVAEHVANVLRGGGADAA